MVVEIHAVEVDRLVHERVFGVEVREERALGGGILARAIHHPDERLLDAVGVQAVGALVAEPLADAAIRGCAWREDGGGGDREDPGNHPMAAAPAHALRSISSIL